LQVFDIFDTDSTGGIDQHEFHQITALLGNHASETETRALFLSADKVTLTLSIMLARLHLVSCLLIAYSLLLTTGHTYQDCNGLLDVAEFTALLRSLSPAARSDDAHYVRTLQAHCYLLLLTTHARAPDRLQQLY